MLRNYSRIVGITILFVLISYSSVFAHCEIPCGIYNDKLRVDLLKEHITTIEKSMSQIIELSEQGDKNYNQLVRWINNKEEHANQFQHIVTQYFMTQRIKVPNDLNGKEQYLSQLSLLHEMLVLAMKCKQTINIENCNKLKQVIENFVNVYFDKDDLEHLKKH